MSIDQIASEALRLSPHDRAMLAQTIWESLEAPYLAATDMPDDEAIALVKQRATKCQQRITKAASP